MNKDAKSKVFLTLLCEWEDCMMIYDNLNHFASHIKEHLDETSRKNESELSRKETNNNDDEDVSKDKDTGKSQILCLWKDCGSDSSFDSHEQLTQHVFYHAFHQKLKCQGIALLQSKPIQSKCQLDCNSRNFIPDLPFKLFCCWQDCQEKFDKPEEFYDHVSGHVIDFPCGNHVEGGCKCMWESCQTTVKSKHKLRNHLRSHTQEKVFACPTCGGLFVNATKFLDHVERQVNSATLTYRCSYCSKMFPNKRFLRDHMRYHVYHYKCPFCEMTCPNPSSLRTHIRYRHSEHRPFSCHLCPFKAKLSVDLKRHLESHVDDWIECELNDCLYRCRFNWEMNLHVKNKHEGLEVAKYLCHLCSHKYTRGAYLTRHLKKKHRLKEPSGHVRLRYKLHDDGFYRLQEFRYESSELQEQSVAVLDKTNSKHDDDDDDGVMSDDNDDDDVIEMEGEEIFYEN